MIIALTFLVLLMTAFASLSLRLVRPGFSYYWLVASAGALFSWLLLLLSNPAQPVSILFAIWKPQAIFPASPMLFLDRIAWAFSLGIATLLLSAILISVAHSTDPTSPRPSWQDLTGLCLITAASLLAICAGNLLTLLLVWTLVDLIEFIAWLVKIEDGHASHRLTLAFAGRIISLIFLLWAMITADTNILRASALVSTITASDPAITPYLIIACAIRLSVLPLSPPLYQKIHAPSAVKTALSLIPLASSLALLCRIAAAGVQLPWSDFFTYLAAIMAIWGSLRWLTSRDTQTGLADWTTSFGALAIAAALHLQPDACQAFGLAMLLTGGFLLFFGETGFAQIRPNWLRLFFWIGALSLSALPWTPTWPTVQLYASPFQPALIFLFIAQAGLLAGTLRHTLQGGQISLGSERWGWALYIWGLALLALAAEIVMWRTQTEHPTLAASWPSLASLLLACGFFWLARRKNLLPDWLLHAARGLSMIIWPIRALGRLLLSARVILKWSNDLLESQAGLLWSFLALVLLLTLFSQTNWGR